MERDTYVQDVFFFVQLNSIYFHHNLGVKKLPTSVFSQLDILEGKICVNVEIGDKQVTNKQLHGS